LPAAEALRLSRVHVTRSLRLPSRPRPAPPAARAEAVRTYLRQLRETAVVRLVPAVFATTEPGAGPSKHWLMFAKRRFMNRELP
jgi:hypothetical protein